MRDVWRQTGNIMSRLLCHTGKRCALWFRFYNPYGFSVYEQEIIGFTTRHRLVVVPYWAPCAAFAVLPAAWGIRWMRGRRRFGPGLCPRCGYDLRATPEKCPECGRANTAAAAP